ncbi:hypothetical protein QBC39DRAFT_326844 [Podospora conica]|nr:hypothetical protein QBC39DRAFT_326844 [Schizothecium conicum]
MQAEIRRGGNPRPLLDLSRRQDNATLQEETASHTALGIFNRRRGREGRDDGGPDGTYHSQATGSGPRIPGPCIAIHGPARARLPAPQALGSTPTTRGGAAFVRTMAPDLAGPSSHTMVPSSQPHSFCSRGSRHQLFGEERGSEANRRVAASGRAPGGGRSRIDAGKRGQWVDKILSIVAGTLPIYTGSWSAKEPMGDVLEWKKADGASTRLHRPSRMGRNQNMSVRGTTLGGPVEDTREKKLKSVFSGPQDIFGLAGRGYFLLSGLGTIGSTPDLRSR